MNESDGTGDRDEMAADRTDLAEDRTMLANERTFAGWARTALASIGVGLGFQALFKQTEPTWVARVIASIFVALGIYLIWKAESRARELIGRLEQHRIKTTAKRSFRIMAVAVTAGAVLLLVAVWLLI